MSADSHLPLLYIGIMSGTSLDGVDAVLASFDTTREKITANTLAASFLPFTAELRSELMALQAPGENEIERASLASNDLARLYASCVRQLLENSGRKPEDICAIGVHGQTIRHQPEHGFTCQINNPALLAELTSIDVIADFRSRDVAAGGQGAPLVPAFHRELFHSHAEHRCIVNVGGISNVTILTPDAEADAPDNKPIIGFDTGPGNVLMDLWVKEHWGTEYDADGQWASQGNVNSELLDAFLKESFFTLAPPKSTGRDLFNGKWLHKQLAGFAKVSAQDVQATLLMLTAKTITDAIQLHSPNASTVYVCGGGAKNSELMKKLQISNQKNTVHATDALGIAAGHVECLAFAWLALRFNQRKSGNLPAVTGAREKRLLGALYPALCQ